MNYQAALPQWSGEIMHHPYWAVQNQTTESVSDVHGTVVDAQQVEAVTGHCKMIFHSARMSPRVGKNVLPVYSCSHCWVISTLSQCVLSSGMRCWSASSPTDWSGHAAM